MEPAEITKVFTSGLTVSVGVDRDFTVTLMNGTDTDMSVTGKPIILTGLYV